MQTVTARTLDGLVELDTVFTLTPVGDGSATYRDALDYAPGTDLGHAPSVHVDGTVDEYGDVHVDGLPMMDGGGWDFYSVGYSQQAGQLRKDPTMYESEFVGGKLARDMITDGGKFVITEVLILTDEDDRNEYEYSGWVVLRKSDS